MKRIADVTRNLPPVGALAPDFTLAATDGGAVHLADAPKPLGLVFLRHLH
jgi:peroxiredoxin